MLLGFVKQWSLFGLDMAKLYRRIPTNKYTSFIVYVIYLVMFYVPWFIITMIMTFAYVTVAKIRYGITYSELFGALLEGYDKTKDHDIEELEEDVKNL